MERFTDHQVEAKRSVGMDDGLGYARVASSHPFLPQMRIKVGDPHYVLDLLIRLHDEGFVAEDMGESVVWVEQPEDEAGSRALEQTLMRWRLDQRVSAEVL